MTGMPMPRPRGALIKDAPDHHDAELVLRLYDLRREASLREARKYMVQEFWPASLDEALAITKSEHPKNAPYRQVTSYWEMAYAMARHGIMNPDYLVENTGEGLLVFAKFRPWLEDFRTALGSPRAFRNAEWIAGNCDLGRTIGEMFSQRVEKAIAARRPGAA